MTEKKTTNRDYKFKRANNMETATNTNFNLFILNTV